MVEDADSVEEFNMKASEDEDIAMAELKLENGEPYLKTRGARPAFIRAVSGKKEEKTEEKQPREIIINVKWK